MKLKPGEVNQKNYTPKELKYKLFKKKTCPACGSKMKLLEEREYTGKYHGGIGSQGRALGEGRDLYQITDLYHCDVCDKTFTITELAEM